MQNGGTGTAASVRGFTSDLMLDLSHTLYHNDLSALPLGLLPFQRSEIFEHQGAILLPFADAKSMPGGIRIPVNHPSWIENGCFRVIERGLGKYLETVGGSPHFDNRILVAGDSAWREYRLRGVVTPLSFDDASPGGGVCGIIARYVDSGEYLALVLDSDGQLKLLQRRDNRFTVLDARPLEFCLGQSLTLSLTVQGNLAVGIAGPYTGATQVQAIFHGAEGGQVGFIADVPARFGPFSVECSAAEAARLASESVKKSTLAIQRRARYPKMRLERTIPLHRLVNGRNIRVVDINGDGKPEIILAQTSEKIAASHSMTRLTCVSVLDLEGKLLWQAGEPDPNPKMTAGDLPFQIHDLYDSGKVLVCVFGYDLQVRHGKTGKVIFSAGTPETVRVGSDFKEIASSLGAPWGDESLNMNVAQIAFCNTLGNGGAREILLKDDFHHLAVLDSMLQPLFRHRGNHGHYPWIGDIDGDTKDEIIAGYSFIDDDGKSLWSLALGDCQNAIAVLDPLNPGGKNLRIIMCAGDEGLLMLNAKSPVPAGPSTPVRVRRGSVSRLSIAKFRADLPGLQIASSTFWGGPGLLNLHDATGKLLWSRELADAGVLAAPVNWTGQPEELMLCSMTPGSGLFDGHGNLVVDAPENGPYTCYDTSTEFSSDGRDAVLAWDQDNLAVYLPEDVPVKGNVYKPKRPGIENSSNYRAYVSVPPGW